jgi:hypothetical protein
MILNLRLGQATGQTRYFDRAERILWSSFLHHMDNSGSMGCGNTANAWHGGGGGSIPWCCDMHGAKGIAYALMHSLLTDDGGLSLVLYHPFTAAAPLPGGKSARLAVATDYPQDGRIAIRIAECNATGSWRLRLRVPAWGRVASLTVNGKAQAIQPTDGWLDLAREWKTGDEVQLHIPMNVWLARPNAEDPIPMPTQAGQTVRAVRVFRGPVLMCVAQACNADLDASVFAQEKARPMATIAWDEFLSPLTLWFGTMDKEPSEYKPLPQSAGRFAFFAATAAKIPAMAVARRETLLPPAQTAQTGVSGENKPAIPDKIDLDNFKPSVPKFEEPAKTPSPPKASVPKEPSFKMVPCRLPVLLVPFADDRAKTGSKIVVFDVVVEK